MSTIRGANKIVVISAGKVVEQGTHDELMALKSEYYSLVTTQVQTTEAISKLDRANSVGVEEMDNISVGKEVVEVVYLNILLLNISKKFN